jgi:uncharacterized membrane protein
MNAYPDVVAQIVNDYMSRLKAELEPAPSQEGVEILKEIESHIYESYQVASGENDVARILNVLRTVGAPSEITGGALGSALLSSGTQRSLPIYIVSGILIALFGIPLGFSGIAILLGVVVMLAGLVVVYYAAAGTVLISALMSVTIGVMAAFYPTLWERLDDLGVIHMSRPLANFLEPLSPKEQGLLFLIPGAICLAAGLAMLRLGSRLIRGLRFIFRLGLDSALRLARTLRRKWRSRSIAAMKGFPMRSEPTR